MIPADQMLTWNVHAEEKPSKTELKRVMHELQALGERLIGLNPEQLAAIALPENLHEAGEQARRITKHEARRRQLQYIGRLMRDVDPEPIREKLKVWDGVSIEETARLPRSERCGCHRVLTTGGTGPAPRDVTPEATLAIADKPMPGFGEQMRRISLEFVPTAILSRQVAVVRKRSLVINLPGQPKSIRETLEGLKDKDGKQIVAGIFAAVPYCIDLIGGPYIETHEEVVRAFRPKSAFRPKAG